MQDEIEKLGISKREATELINTSKNIKKDYQKLLKGYPIQYLIGNVEFYNIKININKNVLIPRYETELLVEKTIQYLNDYNYDNPKILDLCTGSGCIALALKKNIKSIVTATDISRKALAVANKNKKKLGLNVQTKKSNMLKKINNKFDLIITNPPYVNPSEKLSNILKYEPKIALFAKEKGNYYIKKIIKESKNYLKEKSILAIEINNYNPKELKQYATRVYPNAKIKIEKDLTKKDRYLFVINE